MVIEDGWSIKTGFHKYRSSVFSYGITLCSIISTVLMYILFKHDSNLIDECSFNTLLYFIQFISIHYL